MCSEIVAFAEGTVLIAMVAVGVLSFFTVLTFVARRVLRLPAATRYWWIGAGAGAVALLGRATHHHGLADAAFVVLLGWIVWFVAVRGVGVSDLDRDMFDQ
jgi:hypothetical protein